MTPDQFRLAVKRDPQQDDLERANCDKAGQFGHQNCGVCEHGLPVFICHDCFVRSCHGKPIVYLPQDEGPNDN